MARKVENNHHNMDRDLGDAWKSAGDLSHHEPELDEGIGLFFGFAAIAFAVVSALMFITLYLVAPRLAQFHPYLPKGIAFLMFALIAIVAMMLLLIYMTVSTGRNLLPPFFSRKGKDKDLIIFITPFAVKLGGLIGMSTDRIASSFLKVNNAIVAASQRNVKSRGVLLLLPRCIQHSKCNQKVEIDINNCKDCGLCDISDIIKICEDNSVEPFVATGGNLARKLIKEKRPSGVIGVACERELLSGIQDTAGLPVYGIANIRPDGPCKDTKVDLMKVDEAIKAFIK